MRARRGFRWLVRVQLAWTVAVWLLVPALASSQRPRVVLAELNGAVDPGSGEYLRSAIERAEKQDAAALVLRLDTPGGLVSTTREIVQAMLDSNVPVIVWVAPSAAHAGSAGVFLTLAAHVSAMAPATNIGAAHPVGIGGGGGGGDDEKEGKSKPSGDAEHMAQKVENDIAAFAQAIAKDRGRNVEWAEKAVRDSVAVAAQEAVDLHVVDFIAKDMDELLTLADGRTVKLGAARVDSVVHTKGAEVVPLDWSLRQKFLHFIGDPNVASLLLSLGGLALLIEFYKPGALVPGIVGVIALLLGVIGVSALPVNAGAVALLVVGVALVAAEAIVGAFGLLGLAGAVCLGAGAVLLVDTTGPDFAATPDFRVDPMSVLPSVLTVALLAIWVGYKAVRAWKLRPVTGDVGLVGTSGTVEVAIPPGGVGKVFAAGDRWNARSNVAIDAGAEVRIARVDGLTLDVEPVTSSVPGSSS